MPDPALSQTCAFALLAAGKARRFGGGKLDAMCAGKPLGLWAAQAAMKAGFGRYVLVTGQHRPRFAHDLEGWEMAAVGTQPGALHHSIHRALSAADDCPRLVIALADMPLIGSAHLARLRDAAGITFTGYEGEQYGVPAAFPAACYERLASTNTGAARAFARDQVTILPPASKDQLLDIDRPADLTSAERILTHD